MTAGGFPDGTYLCASVDRDEVEDGMVLNDWARELVARHGISGALDAVDRYVLLGWISPDVKRALLEHARGLTDAEGIDPTPFEEAFDGGFEEPERFGALAPHAISLQYAIQLSDGVDSLDEMDVDLPAVG